MRDFPSAKTYGKRIEHFQLWFLVHKAPEERGDEALEKWLVEYYQVHHDMINEGTGMRCHAPTSQGLLAPHQARGTVTEGTHHREHAWQVGEDAQDKPGGLLYEGRASEVSERCPKQP